jgi:hypothetical protein
MSLDLASIHIRLWRLHIGFDVEIEDAPEREEAAAPLGFGSPIDVPEVEEDGGDLEDRRVGFVLPP